MVAKIPQIVVNSVPLGTGERVLDAWHSWLSVYDTSGAYFVEGYLVLTPYRVIFMQVSRGPMGIPLHAAVGPVIKFSGKDVLGGRADILKINSFIFRIKSESVQDVVKTISQAMVRKARGSVPLPRGGSTPRARPKVGPSGRRS